MTVTIRQKPIEATAIQWENNEVFIRQFVTDDRSLRFPDGRLEVWNEENQSWSNVPMFHYIVRGTKGELVVVSPEVLERTYDIVKE